MYSYFFIHIVVCILQKMHTRCYIFAILLSHTGWYESEGLVCLRDYLERSKNYVPPLVDIANLPEAQQSSAEKIWKSFLLKFGNESKAAYEKVQVVVEQKWNDVRKKIPPYVPKDDVKTTWLQEQYFEIVNDIIAEDKAGQRLKRQRRKGLFRVYIYICILLYKYIYE